MEGTSSSKDNKNKRKHTSKKKIIHRFRFCGIRKKYYKKDQFNLFELVIHSCTYLNTAIFCHK